MNADNLGLSVNIVSDSGNKFRGLIERSRYNVAIQAIELQIYILLTNITKWVCLNDVIKIDHLLIINTKYLYDKPKHITMLYNEHQLTSKYLSSEFLDINLNVKDNLIIPKNIMDIISLQNMVLNTSRVEYIPSLPVINQFSILNIIEIFMDSIYKIGKKYNKLHVIHSGIRQIQALFDYFVFKCLLYKNELPYFKQFQKDNNINEYYYGEFTSVINNVLIPNNVDTILYYTKKINFSGICNLINDTKYFDVNLMLYKQHKSTSILHNDICVKMSLITFLDGITPDYLDVLCILFNEYHLNKMIPDCPSLMSYLPVEYFMRFVYFVWKHDDILKNHWNLQTVKWVLNLILMFLSNKFDLSFIS